MTGPESPTDRQDRVLEALDRQIEIARRAAAVTCPEWSPSIRPVQFGKTSAQIAVDSKDLRRRWLFAGSTDGHTAEHVAAQDPATTIKQLEGRRNILQRHAPKMHEALPYRPAWAQCEHCASLCHSTSGVNCEYDGDAPWPCVDWRDASAGLEEN